MPKWVIVIIIVLVIVLAIVVKRRVLRSPIAGGGHSEAPFPFVKDVLPDAHKMFAALRRLCNNLHRISVKRNFNTYRYLIERRFPRDYLAVDGISNHFTEEVRVHCRFGGGVSPFELWNDSVMRQRILRKTEAVCGNAAADEKSCVMARRDEILRHVRFCNAFNATAAAWIYAHLADKMRVARNNLRVLDMSAGWGDRAIAACAVGVGSYHGFDPDTLLQPCYKKIFDEFRPSGAAAREFHVRAAPFESSLVPAEFYDIAFSSPPYFDLEAYPDEGDATAREHRVYKVWLQKFYRAYLERAWDAIKPGGRLVLYVQDIISGNERHPLAEDTVKVLDEIGAPVPMICGFRTLTKRSQGKIRPFFIWKKPARPTRTTSA